MKLHSSSKALQASATEALRTLLDQVSSVKIREISLEPSCTDGMAGIRAEIDVLGHGHTLACTVQSTSRTRELKSALARLKSGRGEEAKPVLIAPHLTRKAQELCRQSRVGFLDFDGNARLDLDEVFILKHLMAPRRDRAHSAVSV